MARASWNIQAFVWVVVPLHQMAPRLDTSSSVPVEEDETFLNIKRAILALLDDGDVAKAPSTRRKVFNTKLTRTALLWGRFVKKVWLFMRNDSTGRFCSCKISAIDASSGHL